MKLKFLLNNIGRDLSLLDWAYGEDGKKRVSLKDVEKIINRWSTALEDEQMLKANEQRFQDLLNKEDRLTQPEAQEAMELVVFIHKPLIKNRNDVMGVRLKDCDYLRLQNKLSGLPLETGLSELNQKIEMYEKAERKKKAEERAKRKAEAELNRLI